MFKPQVEFVLGFPILRSQFYFICFIICQLKFVDLSKNLHETLVSQEFQLVLGAQVLLQAPFHLAPQRAPAHQTPPDSVIEKRKHSQIDIYDGLLHLGLQKSL